MMSTCIANKYTIMGIIDEQARDITSRLVSRSLKASLPRVVIIGIMEAGLHYSSDLALQIPLSNDLILVTPNLMLPRDLEQRIADKHVIIADTMVDTGQTMLQMANVCLRIPGMIRSLTTACLVRRITSVYEPDFVGIDVSPEDGYLWGYGLDNRQGHDRNMYGIYSDKFTVSNLSPFRSRDRKIA